MAEPEPTCSFCAKEQNKVLQIIAGANVFICNECVQLCVEIIAIQNPEWLEQHRKFVAEFAPTKFDPNDPSRRPAR